MVNNLDDRSCFSRYFPIIAVGLLVVVVLVAIAAFGLLTYNGTDKVGGEGLDGDKKNDTSTTTCLPVQSYNWKTTVNKRARGKAPFDTHVFVGKVTHSRMLSICDRISRRRNTDLTELHGASYFVSREDENVFDEIIRSNKDVIFRNLQDKQKLMWINCLYNMKKNRWYGGCPYDRDSYENFCNKDWQDDMKTRLQHEDETVYVVKDYGKPNACWQLYSSKQLASIMNQPTDTIPRLPFACITQDEEISGQNAIPGFFHSLLVVDEYLLYGVAATIEDAKKECQIHNHQLITIDTAAKKKKVEMALLRLSVKDFDNRDTFWTGGYFDVSNGNTRNVQWLGSPNVKTTFDSGLFRAAELEKAAVNLVSSINRTKFQSRDCASRDYVYLGLQYPNKNGRYDQKPLVVLNSDGQLDEDFTRAYVMCEKKL